jgi:hypothetical protein
MATSAVYCTIKGTPEKVTKFFVKSCIAALLLGDRRSILIHAYYYILTGYKALQSNPGKLRIASHE